MTDDFHGEAPDPEEPGSAQARPSPGQLLLRARTRQEQSLEQISAQTMLPQATIVALENDDFERLAQPVFARGYYRKCAKVLGVPEEQIMAAYSEWTGVPAPRPATPGQVDVIPEDVTPHGRRGLAGAMLILAIIAAGVFTWVLLPSLVGNDQEHTIADQTTMAAETAPPAENPVAVETAEPAIVAPDRGDRADVAAPPSGGVAAVPDATGSAPDTDETGAPAPARADQKLILRFDQRSWVEVRDASGARLLVGVIGGGNLRVIEGEPPYHVTLGYAPGVTVSLGERVVYSGEQYNPDNTARFAVAADGSLQ